MKKPYFNLKKALNPFAIIGTITILVWLFVHRGNVSSYAAGFEAIFLYGLIFLGFILTLIGGVIYKITTDFKRSLKLLFSVGVGIVVSGILGLITKDYWFNLENLEGIFIGLMILLVIAVIVAYGVENYILKQFESAS